MNPREVEAAIPAAGARETHGVPSAKRAAMRGHVLIVDDDPHLVQLARYYLEEAPRLAPEGLDLELHRAASGEEALDTSRDLYARGERVVCALLDVVMGGIDGLETARRLWDLDPEIHITLVTGEGPEVEEEIEGRFAYSTLDRWDYVSKPFTRLEIQLRVRRAVSSWHSLRREEEAARENLLLLVRLARANCELEETVASRTRDLHERHHEQERKNQELQNALNKLATAQTQLLQQEKLASIGQLAAGVAHELNNPIGFVHSNLGTLGRYFEKIRTVVAAYDARLGGDDPELSELKKKLKVDYVLEDLPALISESLEGTERVRKIVADLKLFSRPGGEDYKYADLNEGLRSTLNIVHNELKYKAEVITEFGEIPPVRCLGGQINQVFLNLLVNAAQAIDQNGEIRITTRADGSRVVVAIRDNGCGIPQELQRRIFDPFFTTKEPGKGTGLGLSISGDIVRKHGGEIEVESAPGKGSCFTIRLPIDGPTDHDGQ